MALDFKGVLDTINKVLAVIKTVAAIPGVSIIPYASTLSSAIDALQLMIAAGQNIVPFINNIKDTFLTPVKTAEDIAALDVKVAALDAKIAELRAKLHAPLPPREEGEPE